MIDSLLPFFKPRGVVVVGASRDPSKLGYGMARNLAQSGYAGAIHFVNPRGGELLGLPIYTRLADVPDPVDLAVLLTPPPSVPDMLAECGERGIRAVIIATGGFKETGPEGAALEARCFEIARSYGMRLIGPNCIGISDTHLPIDTTFLQPPPPPKGNVSFISHSGAIVAAVVDWVRGQGLGLSSMFSLGNQVDVNETDILGMVGEDDRTHVVTLYLEGISSGRRFAEQARRVSQRKPIVALKVGRFESGQKAVASHTGALAGKESAYDAAFQWAGVLRANTTEEMFQWARALAWSPLPNGRRAAVLTNAGGPGVTAADALEANGLKLAAISAEAEKAMRSFLPSAASLHNPIDMLASAPPEHYALCLKALLEDPGVDSVIVIFPPPPASSAGGVAKAIIPIIQSYDKPVMVVPMGHSLIQESVEFLRAAHIPEFRFPEWAASALGAMVRRADSLQRLQEPLVTITDVEIRRASTALEGQAAGSFMDAATVSTLMEAYRIPLPRIELAASAEETVAHANKVGYPVVLKVASPDIVHKSDAGGVLVGLQGEGEVRQGFATIMQNANSAAPRARIEGVHVQRMIPAGQETIVGMVRDPSFGPLIMFGSGGVEVEGLNDVAFALAPLSRRDAEDLLEKTWAGRKLKGFRNLPPADREAVIDVIFHLAQIALDLPQIQEIEINPLRVLPAGQGAFALDVRAKL